MNITAIRSDRIYRDKLMKPFAFKWSCIGIPLKAETDGGLLAMK